MPRPRVQVSNAPTEHLLSIDAGTDAYTKPLVKPLPLLYHHFPHEVAPSPAASAMYLANSVTSTLKQASIPVILPCKRCTTVKPSPTEIGLSKEAVRCRRIYNGQIRVPGK